MSWRACRTWRTDSTLATSTESPRTATTSSATSRTCSPATTSRPASSSPPRCAPGTASTSSSTQGGWQAPGVRAPGTHSARRAKEKEMRVTWTVKVSGFSGHACLCRDEKEAGELVLKLFLAGVKRYQIIVAGPNSGTRGWAGTGKGLAGRALLEGGDRHPPTTLL